MYYLFCLGDLYRYLTIFFSFFFVFYVSVYLSLILISVVNGNLMSYWMVLEVSLMLFLPFLINNKFGFELSMKYFLVQAMGSFLLIYFFILSFKSMTSLLFILCFKMGLAPFYVWVLFIITKMDWGSVFFFFSLLKFIPFTIFTSLSISGEGIMFLAVLNSLLGGVGGLGCLCLRKLMVYSSLGHSAWVLVCLRQLNFLWLEYYLVYCLIFFCFCYMAFLGEYYHCADMGGVGSFGSGFSVLMVCLSGLPPFSVFMMKVCVLLSLSMTGGSIYIFFLLMFSLLTLSYYLRLSINSYIFCSYHKITKKFNSKISLPFYLFLMVNFFCYYIALI